MCIGGHRKGGLFENNVVTWLIEIGDFARSFFCTPTLRYFVVLMLFIFNLWLTVAFIIVSRGGSGRNVLARCCGITGICLYICNEMQYEQFLLFLFPLRYHCHSLNICSKWMACIGIVEEVMLPHFWVRPFCVLITFLLWNWRSWVQILVLTRHPALHWKQSQILSEFQ